MVKLVPATFEANKREAGRTLVPVLQVTPSFVPCVSSSCTNIWLLAVTRVVLTVQVAPVAFVAHEKLPCEAFAQEATEGLAAVPTAEQLPKLGPVAPVDDAMPM